MLRSLHRPARWWGAVTGVVALVGIGGALLFGVPIATHAQGASDGDSGGPAGSCSSSATYCFAYGIGWYEFDRTGTPANGTAPNWFKNGSQWTDVQSRCAAVGADKVMAFVVLDSLKKKRAVYDYENNYATKYAAYYQSGGKFVSATEAKSRYLQMGGDLPGLTWGVNVGWFCWSSATHWSLSGGSEVRVNTGAYSKSSLTAAPGDTVTWRHTVKNGGPQEMDRAANWMVHGFSGIVSSSPSPINYKGSGSGASGSTFVNRTYTSRAITQADVGGPALCQNISWAPTAWDNKAETFAPSVCVNVPFAYTLVPTITNLTDNKMVESLAGTIPVQGTVTNTGSTKSANNIVWRLTETIYKGVTPLHTGGGIHVDDPCAYFRGSYTTAQAPCSVLQSGTEATGYAKGASKNYAASGTVADYPVGTRICYALSVKRNSSTSGDWRHSKLYCLVIGKYPKVQVLGGDLIVGRGYNTSGTKISASIVTGISKKDATYYGSWAEYALIPSGTITGMASAGGYAGGAASNNLCNATTTAPLSQLSFTNASTATPPKCDLANLGKYALTSPSPLSAIATRFAASATAPSVTGNVDVKNLTAGTIYKGTGTINLSATGAIPAGKWVVINAPTATVRITSNIQYATGALTSLTAIPQLVIIASNITVASNVSNIDAWLLASGTGANGKVVTCDDASVTQTTGAGLTSAKCNTPLTVNGPVMANHLYLYRTNGADKGTETVPAEVFNLRPDAYMWASSFTGLNTKARTVMTTELPPRF